MKSILITIILLFSSFVQAGIINTLPEIPGVNEAFFKTKLSVSVDWEHGNNDKLDIKAAGFLLLQKEFWSVYFVTSTSKLVSSGRLESLDTMNHLRGRYFLLDWFALEIFTQHEYDRFRKLDTRALLGAGPTLKILSTDSLNIMSGTAVMMEYIKPSDNLDEEINARWSNYLQIEMSINSRFSINNIFFYQTKLDNGSDFLIYESISMEIKANKWFGISFGFTISHDSMPLPDVSKTDLALSSSLFIEYE